MCGAGTALGSERHAAGCGASKTLVRSPCVALRCFIVGASSPPLLGRPTLVRVPRHAITSRHRVDRERCLPQPLRYSDAHRRGHEGCCAATPACRSPCVRSSVCTLPPRCLTARVGLLRYSGARVVAASLSPPPEHSMTPQAAQETPSAQRGTVRRGASKPPSRSPCLASVVCASLLPLQGRLTLVRVPRHAVTSRHRVDRERCLPQPLRYTDAHRRGHEGCCAATPACRSPCVRSNVRTLLRCLRAHVRLGCHPGARADAVSVSLLPCPQRRHQRRQRRPWLREASCAAARPSRLAALRA